VKHNLNVPARVRGSISLAPILVISALAAIVTLPGIYRASSYQVIHTNTLYLAENYNDTNAELFSQRDIYGTPTLLGPVTESPTTISAADYISSPSIMDAEIVARAGETFCPGSSLTCVNYEIRVNVENPNMIAESTQKIGIQIVKP
jgi:hypothetical protein